MADQDDSRQVAQVDSTGRDVVVNVIVEPGAKGGGGEQGGKASEDKGGKDGDKEGKDGKDEQKPRSKKPLIIIAIIIVVLGIIGFFVWFVHRNQVSTDDAYTDGNTVSMVPKVSGYVTALNIDDNTHVRKGDLLLQIDKRDYLTAQAQAQAQLALAKAQLDSAQNALRIARVQYPAQLESARAQQQAAAAAAALAQASYERQHKVDKRATTQESIDSSTSQQRSSAANLKGAEAQVAIAKLVPEQVQSAISTVEERQASVQSAQAQLDQASLNLSYTEVRAPSDGFITMRSVQLGSYLTAGQVMFLLVTPEVWVTANYKESQIGRMRIGDEVDIKIDAYSGFQTHRPCAEYSIRQRLAFFGIPGRKRHRQFRENRAASSGENRHRQGPGSEPAVAHRAIRFPGGAFP